jgi:RND family efflux transporter MFP subunit
MRFNTKIAIGLIVTAALALAGYFMLATSHPAHAQATTEPTTDTSAQPSAEGDQGVATVTTAPVKSGQLTQTLKAYGVVAAEPGAVAVYSAQIETRIRHLRVNAGQSVAKDGVLAEIEPSADSRIQMQDASNALASAKKTLADVQQRIEIKLATGADLLTAQQALQTAQLKVDDLRQRGAAEKDGAIHANTAGIVSKIDVQDGQIVPAGGPMIELLPHNRIEVRLGFEPTVASTLKVGQPVRLFPSAGPPAGLSGKIRAISQRLNPDSRLVDVFVTPDSESGLLMDDFVRGEIEKTDPQSLLAPRDAVFPDDTGPSLFTVKDGHAVKHSVTVIAQTDEVVAFSAPDVSAEDQAVVAGSLELEDGMAVNVDPAQ